MVLGCAGGVLNFQVVKRSIAEHAYAWLGPLRPDRPNQIQGQPRAALSHFVLLTSFSLIPIQPVRPSMHPSLDVQTHAMRILFKHSPAHAVPPSTQSPPSIPFYSITLGRPRSFELVWLGSVRFNDSIHHSSSFAPLAAAPAAACRVVNLPCAGCGVRFE